jgi:hypothetical protein
MITQFFVFYNHLSNWIESCFQLSLSRIRKFLGSEPEQYYILNNGDVVPASFYIPEHLKQMAYLYEPKNYTLQRPNVEGRLRPIPILSLVLQENNRIYDLTNWLGEIRMRPLENITPKTIVRLWAYVHNKYVTPNTILEVTKDDGSMETHIF